jgi:hypothetical protein
MGGLTCWLFIAKVEKVQQSFLEGVLRMKQRAQMPHLLVVEGSSLGWVFYSSFNIVYSPFSCTAFRHLGRRNIWGYGDVTFGGTEFPGRPSEMNPNQWLYFLTITGLICTVDRILRPRTLRPSMDFCQKADQSDGILDVIR